MKTRTLGRTGISVSEIGFGGWAIGGGWGPQSDDESVQALHAALDAGVTFIDTAAGYGGGRSERIIGQVLDERGDRDNVYVATKSHPAPGDWPPSPYCKADERYSEQYLREHVEDRLKQLGAERLDLLQLHTWTRAWNDDPTPLEILAKLRDEGKIRHIGISTPEHDQNSVIQLMRAGLLDAVQLIYNIFEQEPAAQLLPVAQETGTAVIVRVPFDEGSLTGKFTKDHQFADGDFRAGYFAGDRLARTVERVDKIKADLEGVDLSMAESALKFCLAHPAVSVVIPGMRTVWQAQNNAGVSNKPDLPQATLEKLHQHAWRRAFWYGGK